MIEVDDELHEARPVGFKCAPVVGSQRTSGCVAHERHDTRGEIRLPAVCIDQRTKLDPRVLLDGQVQTGVALKVARRFATSSRYELRKLPVQSST